MKTIREYIDLIESAQDGTPYELGHWDGEGGEPYDNPFPEGSIKHAEFRKGWRDGRKINHPDEIEEDQATARMGLMSAVGSDGPDPGEQRRAQAQQAIERLHNK